MPRRYVYPLVGLLIAAGAPLGWFAISFLAPDEYPDSVLYLYLGLGSALAFVVFGFFIGLRFDTLRRNARLDSLPGLWDQLAFFDVAQVLLNSCRREDEPLCFLMIDIDKFKKVNDLHNHLFGSFVITQLGATIRRYTRNSDVVGRYGGDEFIVCLPRTLSEEALVIAERIRFEVERLRLSQGAHETQVTLSIGVAEISPGAQGEMSKWVEAADQALYEAKRGGRNQVVLWAPEPARALR